MCRFFIVIIMMLQIGFSLLGQLQLDIESSGELAAFQSDLTQVQGGYLNIMRGTQDSLGYLGVHPLRPADIEFGTALNTNSKVTFSFSNVPALTIDNFGDVQMRTMVGSNFGQVFASPEGKISKLEGEQVYTAHFAHFRPSDVDGEFVEIVQPTDEVEFVKHQSNVGELSAPLKLPEGAIITKLKVYYINESSDNSPTNAFQACIEGARSDANFVFQGRTPWLDLPVGGNFFSGNFGDNVVITTSEHDVAPIKIKPSGFYYNVIVKCNDCSEQYIRAVDIIYKF